MKTLRIALALLAGALPAGAQTEYWRVTPWDLWAATPTFSSRCSTATGHCFSNIVFPDRHIFGYQENGAYGVITALPTGTGVTRDYVGGVLRCFSDMAGACGEPSYPPGYAPAVDFVPVLDPAALGTTQPTPAAKLYFAAKTFQVNIVSTADCSVSYSGPITQSGAHFMLSSLDLGPGIGVVPNVYVQEFYSGVPAGAVDPRYGSRMERYFFAAGLGRVRQEGWNDPSCTSAATCLGNYTQQSPAPDTWLPSGAPAVVPVAQEICP